MALWTGLGQAATVAQLVGAEVGGLISMIVQSALTARQNRSECEQLARQVLMIAQLLPHVQEPEAAQPLAGLGDTLRDANELIVSCQGRSAAYQFIMAGRTAERFREVQSKIDSYLIVFPVISHIGITRRLERIYNVLVPDDSTSTRGELSPLPESSQLQELTDVAQDLMFELGANCALTTQRIGRHLIILHDWNRDKIVFESMDFSRLSSLTVFGEWKSFFISENMILLRVPDLEDASGVEYEDLENVLKWLRRLNFLSLRGRCEIHHLPDNMDHLRQLQTLDVRGTSILTLPENITKLQKLQYIRAGATVPAASAAPAPSCCFCIPRRIVGVQVPRGIGKLMALHTLGVVNIAASGGKAMAKALKKLTQLRKLGVSGVNRKNSKDIFSAIKSHVHLESLSVQLDKDNQGCCLDDQISLPWKNLRSLKLYGLQDRLPLPSGLEYEQVLIDQFSKLTKMDLEMATINKQDIKFLGMVPELCILRLLVKQPCLHFYAELNGMELRTYEKVKILEIGCSSSSLSVEFGSEAMKNLELLKLDCSSGMTYS